MVARDEKVGTTGARATTARVKEEMITDAVAITLTIAVHAQAKMLMNKDLLGEKKING